MKATSIKNGFHRHQVSRKEEEEKERATTRCFYLSLPQRTSRSSDYYYTKSSDHFKSKMSRELKRPIVYCCISLATILICLLVTANNLSSGQCQEIHDETKTPARAKLQQSSIAATENDSSHNNGGHHQTPLRPLFKRSPLPMAPPMRSALLMPINELRVSGSKSEPPSRPSVDWSKQRPHFGADMVRNVSVELGKTAYLTCKVFELGDKTVSWLRPRENEILTAGRYTYIGDSRFASINDNGSHDWILEIKDVGLNDSTSYECQVSTDPKMSTIINLQVKAAKSRIKQGEQYYAPLQSNIEFTCEISQKTFIYSGSPSVGVQQTYWYHNGNLLNYARTIVDKNFSIEWDPMTQTSKFKLYNLQSSDAGNYTCKPTSAEPTTIRLHLKKPSKSGAKDRSQHSNGYHAANTKEAQRNRQHYGLDSSSNGLELMDSSGSRGSTQLFLNVWTAIFASCLTLLLTFRQHH